MSNTSETPPLSRLLSLLDLLIFASAAVETAVFFGGANLYATCVLCLSWVLIRRLCLTESNLTYYPASFLMMLGLALFYYVLPIPLTLIEGKEVTYNLRIPFTTITHHGLFAIVISFTHFAYTTTSVGRNPIRDLLSRTTFYRQPTNKEIWVSAAIAFSTSFYTYFFMGTWQIEAVDRGPAYYISSTFAQFIWMPLLLLFPKLRGIQPQVSLSQRNGILLYALAIALVAIASNWRTILFSGIVVLAILTMLSWLQRDFKILSNIRPRTVFISAILLYTVTGPLTDIGYAMVSVRGSRTDISASDLVLETFLAYTDKSAIDSAKMETKRHSDRELLAAYHWNEEYLSNAIANRFVNLKISDNSLFYAEEIGTPNTQMQEEMLRQLTALLPNRILNFLGIGTDQKFSINYSIGDYLYSLAVNDSGVLGSAVISSMPGVGMSIFGYWYLIVLIPLFSVTFYLFDAMSTNWKGRAFHSYLFFATIVTTMNYFNDRHVFVMDIRYVFRTYWESLIFFFLCMYIVRLIAAATSLTSIDTSQHK